MSRATALPGAKLFPEIRLFCWKKPLVRQASLPGAELFPEFRFCLKKQLVRGSCATWARTVSHECVLFWKKPLVWGSCAAWGRTFSRNLALLKHITSTNSTECTFRISGTPVRRTRRQKYQKLHLQEVWDSCAQKRTSEISKNVLSGIMGLLCAEQSV